MFIICLLYVYFIIMSKLNKMPNENSLVDLTEISSLQLKDSGVSKVIDMVDAGMLADINWSNLQFALQ